MGDVAPDDLCGFNELDLRVDVFRKGIPTRPDNPDSWPWVRVTHLGSGVSAAKSAPSPLTAKYAALQELRLAVEAKAREEPVER